MPAVEVAVLYLGYVQACSRFYGSGEPVHVPLERALHLAAEGKPVGFGPSIRELGPSTGVDSYIPLFEALNWATSLESRITTDWPDQPAKDWFRHIPCGLTVRGVRFARHRVHHQWADAFMVRDEDRVLPPSLVPWIWRQELPGGRIDRAGERLYREDLAGEPVIGALGRLLGVFGLALHRLHDEGIAEKSDLLAELLPVIDGMNPEEFSRDSIA